MEEAKLRQLLKSLTIEEKIGQLVQLSGEFYNASDISMGPQRKLGITQRMVDLSGSVLNVAGAKQIHRLQEAYLAKGGHAIPLLFMSDIVYGYKTVYPIPLGMGASWDPRLIKRAYENAAEEAYAGGQQVAFAPMVDLVHDARWGRVLESTGEDPYLNAQFAKAMVGGFQSGLKDGKGIVSCVKHFAGYGAVEAGREYNSADMSMSNLYQNYLPSYKAAIQAGAKMVMTSLTTLNGVPATADKWLLNDLLRKQWGFTGVVISDYASIYELTQHGFAANEQDAAYKALDAGVDIDMKSPCYANGLKPLLEDGRLSEEKIDAAVWRVLSLKNELGLFEDPFRGSSEALEKANLLTPAKRQLARKVSQEAMVLLKNERHLLPLNRSGHRRVALIGPYADESKMLGLWAIHGYPKDTITFKHGLSEYLDTSRLTVEKGTDIIRDADFFAESGRPEDQASGQISDSATEKKHHDSAVAAAKRADIIIFAGGEHTLQSGEAGSRTKLRLPDNQQRLLDELATLGKPIISVIISGRPLVLTDVLADSDAVIQAWFPGIEGGHALADIIFGAYNPSGRLSMSMPAVEGQAPIYYNHLSTGRPEKTSQHVGRFVSRYTDAPTGPLFPFGYGLSYGKVTYHQPTIDQSQISSAQSVTIRVPVENTSEIDRTETVQLYLHDEVASIVQPVKRLIDFKRALVPAGETLMVSFVVKADRLGFYNQQGKYVIEPGKFELMIGPNSDETQTVEFSLKD
ncbi:beta-glucosidase BglX [Lacticaseibacillus camelliae]|uniref:beta-glucosidase BglX n=1 Tax=Lacticaseibacillus camelliae TaxID=381742 RepID=UPI00070512D7|nr:beta-glucosidase BglX [Lacticaseibacillus camelliae]